MSNKLVGWLVKHGFAEVTAERIGRLVLGRLTDLPADLVNAARQADDVGEFLLNLSASTAQGLVADLALEGVTELWHCVRGDLLDELDWEISETNYSSNKNQPDPNTNPLPRTYANNRPSYARNQVETVWENAKDPVTGKVYDPSGVEIIWDSNKPRNGQWDMGHIPGEKYSVVHEKYMKGEITKGEFLEWYRDPKNYRPELPSTNRSHRYE